MIEKIVKIIPMRQSSSDCAYWRSRPVRERIDALNRLDEQEAEEVFALLRALEEVGEMGEREELLASEGVETA